MKKIINYKELVLVPLVTLSDETTKITLSEIEVLEYKEKLKEIFDEMGEKVYIDTHPSAKENFDKNYKGIMNIYEKNEVTKYSLKNVSNLNAIRHALGSILTYDIYSVMVSEEALNVFTKSKKRKMVKNGYYNY